jgi:SAM-dependent methyltransferase
MDIPRWFTDELMHAGDEHLDPEYVLGYERKADMDPTDDLAMLRDLGLDETCTLVDLGTGTGTLALAAAPLCRRVVAVDVSSEMVNLLREKVHRLDIENFKGVRSGFLTYEHQGDSADFVYSRNALHHLPDFWKALALARTAAFLKPGGVLRLRDLIFSFEPVKAEQAIEAWLSDAAQRPEDGWTRAELEAHVREEHSTFSWLLEPMLERAGFVIQDASHSTSRIFSAYTCVKAR